MPPTRSPVLRSVLAKEATEELGARKPAIYIPLSHFLGHPYRADRRRRATETTMAMADNRSAWQQQHRIPAFGHWNYIHPRDCDDWPPVTPPCFDFASAMQTTAARPPNKRSSMANARRMRIPAFGEWNHHGDDGGNGIGNGTWPAAMTPFFDLATPQKAPNKTMRRRRRGDGFGAAKLPTATAAAEAPQGHVQTRRSKVADSGAYAAAARRRRSCFTVAKPVDDDLYGVPPDMMLYGKPPAPRKDGWLRILRLLGCSCLSPS